VFLDYFPVLCVVIICLDMDNFSIQFLSHRWFRRGVADDEENSKARLVTKHGL